MLSSLEKLFLRTMTFAKKKNSALKLHPKKTKVKKIENKKVRVVIDLEGKFPDA